MLLLSKAVKNYLKISSPTLRMLKWDLDAYWVAHLWLRTFLCQAYESIFFTFIWQFSTPILPKCSWNWIFAWIMPILSRICEWPFPSNLFLFISKKKLKSCRKKKHIFGFHFRQFFTPVLVHKLHPLFFFDWNLQRLLN